MTIWEAATHRFKPTPVQYYYLFGGGEPVLKVAPGDRLLLWREDALNGKIKGTEDLASKSGQRPNPQTGPIHVEGAESGDTLALKIVDIQFDGDYGSSPFLRMAASCRATSSPACSRIRSPRSCTSIPSTRRGRPPPFFSHLGKERHADCVETKPGTTVYRLMRSAPCGTGDIHVTQGDGEILGVAIEITEWVTINVLPLIKGKRSTFPGSRMTSSSCRWEAFAHWMTACGSLMETWWTG